MKGASLLVLAVLATRLAAQNAAPDVRTLHVSRGMTGDSPLHVNVTYGVGTLTLAPATTPVLYDVRMSYGAEQSTPQVSYSPSGNSLNVGIKDGSFHNVNFDSAGFLRVALSPANPLDLSLKIGAAQATLNLGGLSVHNLTLKGGATQTTVNFDSPNLIQMESMTMEVGAAQFEAHGLANARVKNMTVGGAAGQIELWFDGTWTNDVTLRSKIFLGEMKIHVPADVQVVSTAKAILGSVDDQSGDNGKANSGNSDASDSSDMDMSDSSDDSDDSDSSSSAAASKNASVEARIEAAKAREEAAKAREAAANARAEIAQARAQVKAATKEFKHTLYITGSATVGSLEIIRDAATAPTSSH